MIQRAVFRIGAEIHPLKISLFGVVSRFAGLPPSPYADKINKPLNFGCLDFSTQALRQQDSEEELRLNRCPFSEPTNVPELSLTLRQRLGGQDAGLV